MSIAKGKSLRITIDGKETWPKTTKTESFNYSSVAAVTTWPRTALRSKSIVEFALSEEIIKKYRPQKRWGFSHTPSIADEPHTRRLYFVLVAIY